MTKATINESLYASEAKTEAINEATAETNRII
jgi:hypothetical protein